MKNFVTSTIIGISIYLIAFLIYYLTNFIFARQIFIALLIIGSIFWIPLLMFIIFFIIGFFTSFFKKENKKGEGVA